MVKAWARSVVNSNACVLVIYIYIYIYVYIYRERESERESARARDGKVLSRSKIGESKREKKKFQVCTDTLIHVHHPHLPVPLLPPSIQQTSTHAEHFLTDAIMERNDRKCC